MTDLQTNDLHRLIRNKEIKIIGGNTQTTISESTTIKSKVTESLTQSPLKSNSTDLEAILEEFKRNCFDPKIDFETKIHSYLGNYILCLRKNSKLSTPTSLTWTKFDGLDVIPTGIAGNSLRTRDYRQHFKG